MEAFILSIKGEILHNLYETHKNALFSANLRDFLGARKVSGNVNNRIRSTAEQEPGMFFVLNNGITLVTKKADVGDSSLRIHGVSVVNGAQTTGAIHAVGADRAKNFFVSVWLSIVHILVVPTLGWAYDRVKQDLKAKSDSDMTDIEHKQLRLLDYPASKQFLIRVVGDLREEIAGRRVSKAQAFEIKPEFIIATGDAAIQAWVKVLRSILPIIVQNLPAEEYQVVRSTDYTETVSQRAKGIVAGAEVLQTSFKDLRDLLSPA